MSSTVDTTDQSQPDRVCLNLRVSQSVKENYEAAITEKYGKKRPYTGTELEREMRLRLDTGKTFELYSSIQDLAEVYGKANREKKFFSTPSGDDTVILKYRVAEPIRRGIMSLAAERDKGAGEFVESIMHRYARGEGADERMIDLTNRVKQATDHKFNDELSAVEKRTKAIAAELDSDFKLSEFMDAIESATKFSDSTHNRNTYLPRVLDEKGCTWHPEQSKSFIPTDDVPPEQDRDPRNKPYPLMDDSDKKLALKCEVYHADGNSQKKTISVSDAVSAIGSITNPQRVTAKQLMREVANTDGFGYVHAGEHNNTDAGDLLSIEAPAAVESSPDHKDLQRVLADDETDDDGSTSADEQTETDGTQWVQQAAENLPDAPVGKLPNPVIKNKIAEATNDEIDRDESGSIPDELLDAITDEQIAQVRQYAADGTEKPDDEPSKGGVSTDETTTQHAGEDIDEQFEALNQATAVRADGGKPTT